MLLGELDRVHLVRVRVRVRVRARDRARARARVGVGFRVRAKGWGSAVHLHLRDQVGLALRVRQLLVKLARTLAGALGGTRHEVRRKLAQGRADTPDDRGGQHLG